MPHTPPVPLKERWFEDFTEGEVFEFGDCLVTEGHIVHFAQQYDPQPFHTDPAAAQHSSFGSLVASGWMTGALVMRMMVDHFIAPQSAMGSPGLDQVRWLHPVRPGDKLHVRVTLLEARRSASKPDRGVLKLRQEAINQDGIIVMSMEGLAMQRCRP